MLKKVGSLVKTINGLVMDRSFKTMNIYFKQNMDYETIGLLIAVILWIVDEILIIMHLMR